MARSSRVRLGDLRAIYGLAGECRELGDDAVAWRVHFAERLGRLIHADLVFCVETADCRGGRPVDLGVAEWGWENGFDRSGWVRALVEFRHDPFYSLGLRTYLGRFAQEDGVAHARRELIADGDWQASFDREVIHQVVGIDHVGWCFRSIAAAEVDQAGVIAARGAGEPDFDRHELAILAEAQAAFAPLVGGPLARFADPSPTALSPRVRQVLRSLLEGDTDKQTAARLGISRLTVNVHTKAIYRHFGVRSRAELLSRWIRRGWPIGPWSPPDPPR